MSGRWDRPGVPHKGWSFDQMEDAQDATSTCEMCGNEKVRYVHVMSHPAYGTLRVGCVCAEKMQGEEIHGKAAPKAPQNPLSGATKVPLTRAWGRLSWRKIKKYNGGADGTRTRDPRRDRPVF